MAKAVAPSQSSKPAPLECSSMHAEEIEWRDTLAAEIVFCQRPVGLRNNFSRDELRRHRYSDVAHYFVIEDARVSRPEA